MKFGKDFFQILEFVVAILRLFARVFGDDDDRKADDEQQAKNGAAVKGIV